MGYFDYGSYKRCTSQCQGYLFVNIWLKFLGVGSERERRERKEKRERQKG